MPLIRTGPALTLVLCLVVACLAQSAYYDECDARAKRVNCGYVGTDQTECEEAGCCWSPMYTNPANAAWCFYPNAIAAPTSPPLTTECISTLGGSRENGDVMEDFLGARWQGGSRGTTFATWAPHASAVWISGQFGGSQQEITTEMTRCEEGFWAGEVSVAVPGDAYTYIVQYMGSNLTRIDPVARAVLHNSVGEYTAAVIQDPEYDWGSEVFTPPSHMEQVIYELHIPSFNPGNSSSAVGTFQQAIAKLDYLQFLGINVIEPVPVTEYPGDPRGWGYNPGAYYAIMQSFGGYKGMKDFVKAANSRGIAVYMDVVWNHAGSPCTLWQFDGWYQAYPGFPDHQEPGGIYFYENWNANTGWGPRPNYANATVRRYGVNSIAAFMEELHVSGFRFDSTICIRKGVVNCWNDPYDNKDGIEFLQEVNDMVHSKGGFTIAEDLQNDGQVTTPVDNGGVGFDGQWSDTTWYQYQQVLVPQDDGSRSIATFGQALAGTYTDGGQWRVIYTENHDKCSGQNAGQGRWPVMVDSANPTSYIATKLSTLGIATVLTSPGVPMLFYGQEFLDTEDFVFGDVPNLPWSQVGDYAGGAWQSVGPYNGIFNMTQALIALRLNKDGNSSGLTSQSISVFFEDESNKSIAFTRGDDQRILVIMNLSQDSYNAGFSVGCPYGGTWEIAFNSDLTEYNSMFGNVGADATSVQATDKAMHGFNYSVSVPLGAYTTLILVSAS